MPGLNAASLQVRRSTPSRPTFSPLTKTTVNDAGRVIERLEGPYSASSNFDRTASEWGTGVS
jgi:hypothetical protein